jgi:hypothetical protein
MDDNVFYFDDIVDIPIYLASESLWRKRGFKIKGIGSWCGSVEWWNGQNYLRFKLYHINDCLPIRGKKAENRRLRFYKFVREFTAYPLFSHTHSSDVVRKELRDFQRGLDGN